MFAEEDVKPKEIRLNPYEEYRFEVALDKTIKLKLVKGHAEVFGAELAPEQELVIGAKKVAVFTWHGCTLYITGDCVVDYVAEETPMQSYLNVHLGLEQMRHEASANDQEDGPRVMVVGPADVGKTCLVKMLINYAVKMQRTPLFIDLDTNAGTVSLPGTLTATVMTRIVDPEAEFAITPMVTNVTPLCYYYGYPSPIEKAKYYKELVDKLSRNVRLKVDDEAAVRSSGLIINTPSEFAEGGQMGYELLTDAMDAFGVNVVLVIGHERLFSQLSKEFNEKDSGVAIVKLVKSGGVVSRDKAYRRSENNAKIREYFYGPKKQGQELHPYSTTAPFHDVQIRQVGTGTVAPSSALPLGMEARSLDTKMIKIDPGDVLLHAILAVSHLSSEQSATLSLNPDEEARTLLDTNIAGFVYVPAVDETRKKLSILTPSGGRLPKRYLLMAAQKWFETS